MTTARNQRRLIAKHKAEARRAFLALPREAQQAELARVQARYVALKQPLSTLPATLREQARKAPDPYTQAIGMAATASLLVARQRRRLAKQHRRMVCLAGPHVVDVLRRFHRAATALLRLSDADAARAVEHRAKATAMATRLALRQAKPDSAEQIDALDVGTIVWLEGCPFEIVADFAA